MSVPEQVEEAMYRMKGGISPSNIEFDGHEGLKNHPDWEKISAFGHPYRVHTPSGYAIVTGRYDGVAVISPRQMDLLPNTMVSYYRVMEDMNRTCGSLDQEEFRRISLEPDDTGDRGFDRDQLYGQFGHGLTEEQREVVEVIGEYFEVEE